MQRSTFRQQKGSQSPSRSRSRSLSKKRERDIRIKEEIQLGLRSDNLIEAVKVQKDSFLLVGYQLKGQVHKDFPLPFNFSDGLGLALEFGYEFIRKVQDLTDANEKKDVVFKMWSCDFMYDKQNKKWVFDANYKMDKLEAFKMIQRQLNSDIVLNEFFLKAVS